MEDLSVSVIIPTYNRARLVGRAIASVLKAVAPGDEIIVIDDESTDDTEAALAVYRDKIHYVRIPHGGAGAARNRGIAEARNPLIAFLDSDDEWMPHKLLLQRAVMRAHPDLLFCFSDFACHQTGGPDLHGVVRRILDKRWRLRPGGQPKLCDFDRLIGPGLSFSSIAPLPEECADFPVHIGDVYPSLMERSYIQVNTLLVRRDQIGGALRFPEDLPMWEDWEAVGRLARVGPGAYLDCETAWLWRHRQARLTHTSSIKKAEAALCVIKRVYEANPAFVARHGDRLRSRLRTLHLEKARRLMQQGKMEQARQELTLVSVGPLYYWLLAPLPGSLVRFVLRLYRRLVRLALRS